MALAAFSDNFALYDVTPVENIFLLEYMPYAPGDYVRVYLYGLMLCRYPDREGTAESMAKALNMEAGQVLDALRYWEKKGLLEGVGDNPPRFLFRNVRSAMQDLPPREDNPAYAYSDFNNRLQGLFGILHPQQFTMAIEWVEDLHLPAEVVLYMAEKTNELLALRSGGKQRSVGYIFKVLKERAMDWARRGIDTLEKARLEMDRELPPYQLARKVLDQLGLRRNPTAAETDLCRKWLGEWAYDEAGVLAALPETTKSANPSFAYLDGILGGMRNRGGGADQREAVKQVLKALGGHILNPTEGLIQAYEGILRQGFAPETVLRAAALCSAKGQGTFEKLEDVLSKWLRLGLTTPEAVDEYLERRAALRQLTLRVWEEAGLGTDITDASLDQVQEWLEMAPAPLVEYAASQSKGLKLPDRSITKRLKEFKAAGITTLEQAQAFKRPSARSKVEKPAALDYAQRRVDEHYFDGVFADLSAPAEGGGAS